MSEKYAIYDFCQTLIDFETADQFVDFVCESKKRVIKDKILSNKFLNLLSAVIGHYSHRSIYKMLNLKRLQGLSIKEIDFYAEKYYRARIMPHIIPASIEQLKQDKYDGYKIVIVSASYAPFVKLFAQEFGVDKVITNEFLFDDNGNFTGKLIDQDCIYLEKVSRAKKELDIKYFQDSKAYGDSRSDIPILKSVGTGIVISHMRSQEWASKNELKEIVWQ